MNRLALPIVDLAAAEPVVVEALKRAASGNGFFYLANYGVPRESSAAAFAALERWFASPVEAKMRAHQSKTGKFKGYIGFFEQGSYGVDDSDARAATDAPSADQPEPMDFKEVFHIGTELSADHPFYNDLLYSSNVWPEGQVELRAALTTYYDGMMSLSARMFQLFALSLGLPRDFLLNQSVTTPMNSMNCVHYPPLAAFPNTRALEQQQLGIGAHTDFEAFTLLNQHGPTDPCLDILRDGEWTPVPPVDGTLVVNIGDMLARWSGDRFRSTVHRARNHATQDRMSIAFFRAPDFDAVLSSEGVVDPVREYGSVRAGDHMMARVSRANEPLLEKAV